MGSKPNTKCITCGKGFYKRPSQKKKHPNHYCSLECNHKNRPRKNRDKVCETCGVVFKYRQRPQKFCSLKCVASRPRREKWNGGGKSRSKTTLRLLREEGWSGKCMINKCEYCDVLDIHRIIEGRNGGEYILENIVAICPNHHAEIHRLNKKLRRLYKFKYVLEE